MVKAQSRLVVFLLIVSLVLPCYSQQVGEITPVEAIHLVEKIVNQETLGTRLVTTNIKPTTYRDNLAYILVGKAGADSYQSIVDAKVARVMEIRKNGKSFYEWGGVKVVGHRGNVKFTPENTIPGFEIAIEYGADLIEMDVRETKDGELVIIHDETVDRTTNGTGKVSELTLKEIKELDAGSWFSPKFKGVRIPTLKEALSTIHGRALPDIDFKAGTPSTLIKILGDEGLSGEITLYCGDWNLMQETMKLFDGFIIRPTVPIGFVGLPIILNELNPPVVNIDWEQFSEKLVREVHLSGRKSFVNTMQHDTELIMSLVIETAPDYLQTDHIDILMPLLRAKGLHK
ncbi:MAG: glycerophosphodiester phosphodiesterase [bacterium]